MNHGEPAIPSAALRRLLALQDRPALAAIIGRNLSGLGSGGGHPITAGLLTKIFER
jgi:hypothetical protein